MATTKKSGYEILVDELTILRDIGTLTDPNTGEVTGTQQGQGKIWFRGEVVPEDAVAQSLKDALEDEDHPSHAHAKNVVKKVSGGEKTDLAIRLGLPFAGYDDMSEEDVLKAMANLPSPVIQSIKEYEAGEQGRANIVDYNIGFRESPLDRENGIAGSDLDEDNRGDDGKPVSAITTREVTEDGIQRGEGITGNGDPEKAFGTEKEETLANGPASPRRQRRKRATTSKPAASSDAAGSEGSSGSAE